MRRLAFFSALLPVAVITLGLAAASANAEPSTQQTPPAPNARSLQGDRESESYWYGWQTLLVDAASAGSFAVIIPGEAAIVPIGTYVFGGPVVHLVHGEPLRAAGSLLLRLSAPIVFAAVASGLTPDCKPARDTDCEGWRIPIEIGVAAALGAAVASAVDAALLGYGKRTRGPATSAVAGGIVPTHGGLALGMGGSF